MRRLLGYLRRFWLRYAFGIFCTFATASLAMVVPYLLKVGIDAIQHGQYRLLPRVALFICAAAVLMGVARWFSRFIIFNIGRDIEYEVRKDLFTRLSWLGPRFFELFQTGDLMSRMINDISALRMMVGMGVLSIVNAPLYYIYALAFMLSMNARLMAASLAPYLVMFLIVRRISGSLMARNLQVQEGLGAIGAKVQESLTGIHTIKAYAFEDYESEVFRRLNDQYNDQGLALARLRGLMAPLVRLAAASATAIVLIYGGSMVMAHTMTLGTLVAFMGYLSQLAWPTMSISYTINIFQRGRAAMQRLGHIYDAPLPTGLPGLNGKSAEPEQRFEITGAVEWQNVSFSYFAWLGDGLSGQPYALRDISVKVPAGAKLAIVGRTGSGKTTMIKLLVRMLEATSGRVLIDGRDVHEYPLEQLRRAVGVVPQEANLFSQTIAYNVAFGRIDAGRSEIQRAVEIAGLGGDLAAMPGALDTIVGERGMALSGGQKQRVTIARALVYGAPILVMDDALASVDTETERNVLRNLAAGAGGRTTILVSHRASTVRDADLIIVLEDGAIAERGTHESLMERNGIYAELFRRQLLEEELAAY